MTAGFGDKFKTAFEIEIKFLRIVGISPSFEMIEEPIACRILQEVKRHVSAMCFAFICDIGRSLYIEIRI